MADYLNLPKKMKIKLNARLHKRFLSFLIDYLIIDLLILSMFSRSLMDLIPKDSGFSGSIGLLSSNPSLVSSIMITLGTMGVFALVYFAYSQKVFGQTIGMRAMGLRLKNHIKSKEVETWQVVARNLFLIPLFPFFLIWIADVVYLIIYNRKLSDVFAKVDLVEESLI